jgi:hypothetical protein
MTDYYLAFYEVDTDDDKVAMCARYHTRATNSNGASAAASIFDQLPSWEHGPLIVSPNYLH